VLTALPPTLKLTPSVLNGNLSVLTERPPDTEVTLAKPVGTKPTAFFLTPETARLIKIEASSRDVNQSDVVTAAVHAYCSSQSRQLAKTKVGEKVAAS
jgi:hypothetical protein